MDKHHSGLSRRRFLATASGAAFILPSILLYSEENKFDPRVAKVLSRTISIDMHNHVYPAGTEPHLREGSAGPQQESAATLSLAGELNLSGFTAVCASFVMDFAPNKKPGDAWDNFLRWLTALDAELAAGHIHRALNLKDLQIAHARRQPVIIQTVEGAHFLEGRIDRLKEAYNRGLRHLQLLHEKDDMVSPLGDTNTTPAHLGGLTTFGAEVVRECNRLGIVVDLAHASHETVLGVLRVSTQPVLISHTSLDTHTGSNARMAEMMKPRLISRDHAKVIADAGAVIGVWLHMADSLKDFVQSVHEMVEAVGIDHVGIGSDTDLLSPRAGAGTNRAWPGLAGGLFPAVVEEMLNQGFTPSEVSKVGGGNFCRVFGKVTVNGG